MAVPLCKQTDVPGYVLGRTQRQRPGRLELAVAAHAFVRAAELAVLERARERELRLALAVGDDVSRQFAVETTAASSGFKKPPARGSVSYGLVDIRQTSTTADRSRTTTVADS